MSWGRARYYKTAITSGKYKSLDRVIITGWHDVRGKIEAGNGVYETIVCNSLSLKDSHSFTHYNKDKNHCGLHMHP
jgi:hypothetical protein